MLQKLNQSKGGPWRGLKDVPWGLRRVFLSAAIPVALRPREFLFHAGDAGDGCYYMRSGVVKASVVAKDGQERLLAILGPGSLIGELALMDDDTRSASISALQPCQLLLLTKQAFFALADKDPDVYRQVLRLLAHRLRAANDRVVAWGTVTVIGRVARSFALLAEDLGDELPGGRILLPHRITQTDIAGMAGVARENASRAINDLFREGILGRDGSYYTIEKMTELRDMSEI
jgi:CRP-like cAMP-binding protein